MSAFSHGSRCEGSLFFDDKASALKILSKEKVYNDIPPNIRFPTRAALAPWQEHGGAQCVLAIYLLLFKIITV